MKNVVLFFALLLSFAAYAQEDDPGIEAVKYWKSLGVRLAVGYDKDQKVIGVYDLSYAMPWTRTKVGSLSAPRMKVKDILNAIREGEAGPEDQDLKEKAEKELTEKSEQDMDGTLLPDNWREQVPWKSDMKGRSDTFTLADFDLQKVVKEKDLKEFNQELAYVYSLINDGDDLRFLGDLFSQVEVVQNGKAFEFYFNPSVETSKISKPRKIANLRNPKLIFLEALKFELLQKAIKKTTKFIVNPIVKALVDTALNRIFHFYKLMNFSHNHMTLEVLADISDKSGLFPLDVLTEDDKVHMAESLEFSQTSLTGSWKWVFKKPYKEWLSDREDQIEFSANAQKWLAERSINSILINPRFSTLRDADLAVLAMKKVDKKKGPFVAHVGGKMSPHKVKRIAIEIITAAVDFGTSFIPIPFVGGLLEDIYKKFVESPVTKQRYWEARMTAVLEQRQSAMGEDWSTQLASLDGQRVNPFFKKRADVDQLIQSRKKAYDIP